MASVNDKEEFYRKRTLISEVTPTLAGGGAYTAGDAVGALMTFSSIVNANDLGGFLHSICLVDKGAESAVLDLILFNANPSASTFTDNAALVVHANDVGKIIATIPIAADDYLAISASLHVATLRGVGVAFDITEAGNDLYAAFRAAGTPTYAAGDLILKLGVAQG